METMTKEKNGVKYVKFILKSDMLKETTDEWSDYSEWHDYYTDHREYGNGMRDGSPIYD